MRELDWDAPSHGGPAHTPVHDVPGVTCGCAGYIGEFLCTVHVVISGSRVHISASSVSPIVHGIAVEGQEPLLPSNSRVGWTRQQALAQLENIRVPSDEELAETRRALLVLAQSLTRQ